MTPEALSHRPDWTDDVFVGKVKGNHDSRGISLEAMLEQMDSAGIQRAFLVAAKTGRLIHHYEARHKVLLNVSEELGLRGRHMDPVLEQEMAAVRAKALAGMKYRLAKMTLTVIDGEFPREVLRAQDLTLRCYDARSERDHDHDHRDRDHG